MPIEKPAEFEWPGHWIARVRAGGDDHAVVMFGSPSGALHDPTGALARRGTIEGGWLVARLDLRLPTDDPYGSRSTSGTVVGLLVAPDAEQPLVAVDSVRAVAGCGLEGDRYFDGRGTFSGTGRGYQGNSRFGHADKFHRLLRRYRKLQRFRIGEVECSGARRCEPCAHLERLTRPGIIRPLVHRAGLRADILSDGEIALGDTIVPR